MNKKIIQVRTFEAPVLSDLETEINNWLIDEDNNVDEVIDIKFSTDNYYFAMVIYKSKD